MRQDGLPVDASCMLRYSLQSAKYVTRFVINKLIKEVIGIFNELLLLLADPMFKINYDKLADFQPHCIEVEKLCRNTKTILKKIMRAFRRNGLY